MKKIIYGIATSVGALSLAACGSTSSASASSTSSTASATKTINITVAQAVKTLIYLPLYVAKDKGYFAKQGLNVSILTASNGANAVSDVEAGSAQFSLQDPMIGVLANLKGADVKSVAEVVNGVPSWIVASNSSNIKTVSDLAGKTIASANIPNTGSYLLQDQLKTLGLTSKVSIDYVQIGSESAPLLSGQVPAAVVEEPDLARLMAMPNKYHLVQSFTSRKSGGYAYSSIVTSSAYLKSHSSVVARFVKALDQAEQAISSNKSIADSVAAKEFAQLPKSVTDAAVNTLLKDGIEATSTKLTASAFNTAEKLQIQLGNVPQGKAPYSKEVVNFPG